MLKVSVLIVCIAIFGSALSVELDQQITNARADEIAKWAGSKLPEYCGLSGELFVQNVDSVKNELEGDKVRFDMEVSYGTVGDEVNVSFYYFAYKKLLYDQILISCIK